MFAVLVYICAVLLGGALLAPCMYVLVGAFADAIPAMQKIYEQPFSRYMTRSMMLMALSGLWPLFRALGATQARELGLANPKGNWGRFAQGFGLGFGSLAILVAILFTANICHWDTERSSPQIVKHFINAGFSALLVAIMEEILFRGGICGGLRRYHGTGFALVSSSLLFGLVHFFARTHLQGEIHWYTGLTALPQLFSGFADWHAFIPAFFNLTLVGMTLGLAYERTGTLYASIGLHAGWVFWQKSMGFFTDYIPGINLWFWGTEKLIDGWLAMGVLGACIPLSFWLFPIAKRDRRLET